MKARTCQRTPKGVRCTEKATTDCGGGRWYCDVHAKEVNGMQYAKTSREEIVGCGTCGNLRTLLTIREMLNVPPGVDVLSVVEELCKRGVTA